jgi:excinuclease ABC subunit B
LIQTIGRAARNISGQVHMYADTITASMTKAIDETNRRRAKQVAYNQAHGIDPQPLRKRIADITEMLAREDADTAQVMALGGSGRPSGRTATPGQLVQSEVRDLIEELTQRMHVAAGELQFELAARLRDEVAELKQELRGLVEGMR